MLVDTQTLIHSWKMYNVSYIFCVSNNMSILFSVCYFRKELITYEFVMQNKENSYFPYWLTSFLGVYQCLGVAPKC